MHVLPRLNTSFHRFFLQGATKTMNRIHAFWKFCRPHTIIGTNLQLLAAYLFASRNGHYVSIPPIPLLLCWISAMAMNIYVVGINQLVDVDVDKINKKYLPLASGEFS